MVKKKADRAEDKSESNSEKASGSPEAIARQFLTLILRSRGKLLEISGDVEEMARGTLAYIEQLEKPVETDGGGNKPKRRYRSKSPLQAKQDVAWDQPKTRRNNIYIFEIACPYCNQTVTLERLSPIDPAHCDKPFCIAEHKRKLDRERKRRQRGKK
jgi:hypothetical protein